MSKKVFEKINELSEDMKDTLIEMLKYKAIGPDNSGTGEMKKVEFIMNLIESFGFDEVKRYDSPDDRVPSGFRPNIMAVKNGKKEKNVVIISHIDIVPEGNSEEWNYDPYYPIFKNGKVYGRGAEDNGQEIIASLYVVKALTDTNTAPNYNLKLFFVSDEETGSEYGIDYILKKGLISKDDIVIVPDHSEDKGKKIEIIEKGVLWIKITVQGKQGHAAILDDTINANRVASMYQVRVDRELHESFEEVNELFTPPESTFEPTRREKNVPNINTVPGKDIQYFDCRVLPTVDLKNVKGVFEEQAKIIERKTGAKVELEYVEEQSAPATPENSEVVKRLKMAIKRVTGDVPDVVGIGGGTVAAHIRNEGIPVAVWATNDEMAHQPNEYAEVKNIVKDCKVFASLVLD